MDFRPWAPIVRWLHRLEHRYNAKTERVAAVAEYQVKHRKVVIFFMENANGLHYCRVLRSNDYQAETVTEIIMDGVAWCQRAELPKHSRPMDQLPPKEKSSLKLYR